MAISFTNVALCSGGNHVTLSLTEDGVARTIHLDIGDLRHDMTAREMVRVLNLKDERDIDALYLAFQAIKAANADTLVKKRNAILSIQDASVQAARA